MKKSAIVVSLVAGAMVVATTAAWALTVEEEAKLTASDAATGDWFGFSVAIAGDTAVVGAILDGDNGDDSGSAYVFLRGRTGWTEQAKLTASDAASVDNFGHAVALSGDTALVGSPIDGHAGGTQAGSAYVFLRSGTGWTEQAKLTASDAAESERFGYSVAISGDTAVVGAYRDDENGFNSGSAYVFVRSGTGWSEQAKLTASDAEADDQFGHSVALSGDTAVVGARLDDHAVGTNAGSAYVFVRNGTGWSEQAKLIASDAAADDNFGYVVSLSGDTVVVGAYFDDDDGTASGSAYVFVRSGTGWSEQAKLTASDAATNDLFGSSVALSGDTVVVGAQTDDHSGITSPGSAYVFLRSGTSWSERAKLTASDAETFQQFGSSVALGGDTAVVGAYRDNNNGLFGSGSAYVFRLYDGDVPATSVVGLAVLLLVVLSTGVYFMRRRVN